MADPFPKIPMGDAPSGTETIVARQSGVPRRFTLTMLLPFFKGAKGDKGDTGLTGAQGVAGAKGDQGLQGPQGTAGAKGDTGTAGAQGAKGDIGPIGPNPWIDLGTVTVKETVALAVGAAVRTVRVAVPGAKKGVPVTVFPASALQAGYGLSGAVSTLDDTVDVSVTCPALGIGASYNLSVRVLAARL